MKKNTWLIVIFIIIVLVLLFLLFTRNTSAPTLAGIWIGEGYRCTDVLEEHTQEVSIREEGDKVIASKVVGDECVRAGETTWEGTRNGNIVTGEYHVHPVGGEPGTLPATVTVQDTDTLVLEGAGLETHTFTRVPQ